MSITTPKTIREKIVNNLVTGPQDTLRTLELLQKTSKITKQAFYSALRQLLQEEIVIKHKDQISLDTIWISKLQLITETMRKSYSLAEQSKLLHFLSFDDGESATYKFPSIAKLDQFWGNIQNLSIANTSEREHLFVYDPHYFFFIARHETEPVIVQHIENQKRSFLMSVGGNTKLDALIKKEAAGRYVRINNDQRMFEKENYYVTVIGDYIWEVTLDPHIAEIIDELFKTYDKVTPELVEKLEKLLNKKSKNKFKIGRNKKKAESLRKKLSKNFHIK